MHVLHAFKLVHQNSNTEIVTTYSYIRYQLSKQNQINQLYSDMIRPLIF
jgi:hypothetical protein